MDQLIYILVISLFLNIVTQIAFYLQVHTPVACCIRNIFHTCTTMRKFLILTFNGTAFAIHILIETSLYKSFLDAVTIIIDEFELNLIKINQFKCGWDRNDGTIANGRKLLNTKNNYNYDNVNSIHDNLDPIDQISYDWQQIN